MKKRLQMKVKKSVAIISILTSALIFALLIVFFLPGSRAVYSGEHTETTVVSVNMFDDILNAHMSEENAENFLYHLNYLRYRNFEEEIKGQYSWFRERVLDEYPEFDIILFDEHLDRIIEILEYNHVRLLDLSSRLFGETQNGLIYREGTRLQRGVLVQDHIYDAIIKIVKETYFELYNLTSNFFNTNRTYLSTYEYFGFNEETSTFFIDLIQSSSTELSSFIPQIDGIGTFFADTENNYNAFSMAYQEVYRQLSYIEDDPIERKKMIANIFAEAIIDWRRQFLPEYIQYFMEKKYLILRKYKELGALVRRDTWSVEIRHRSRITEWDEDFTDLILGDLISRWFSFGMEIVYGYGVNPLNGSRTEFLSLNEIIRLLENNITEVLNMNMAYRNVDIGEYEDYIRLLCPIFWE